MVHFGKKHHSSKHEKVPFEEHQQLLEKLQELQEEHSDAEQNVALRKAAIKSLEEQLTEERAQQERLRNELADQKSRADNLQEEAERARAGELEAQTDASAERRRGDSAACEYAAALSDATLLKEELRTSRDAERRWKATLQVESQDAREMKAALAKAEGRAESLQAAGGAFEELQGFRQEAASRQSALLEQVAEAMASAAASDAAAQSSAATLSAERAEAESSNALAAAREAEVVAARREVSAMHFEVLESKDALNRLRTLLSEAPELPEAVALPALPASRELVELLEQDGDEPERCAAVEEAAVAAEVAALRAELDAARAQAQAVTERTDSAVVELRTELADARASLSKLEHKSASTPPVPALGDLPSQPGAPRCGGPNAEAEALAEALTLLRGLEAEADELRSQLALAEGQAHAPGLNAGSLAAAGSGAVPSAENPQETIAVCCTAELQEELLDMRLSLKSYEVQAAQWQGELEVAAAEQAEASKITLALQEQIREAEAVEGACREEIADARLSESSFEVQGRLLQSELCEAQEGEERALASAAVLEVRVTEAEGSASERHERAEALLDELASERAAHLAMATAAKGAWLAHSGLREEAVSAEAAKAGGEGDLREELAERCRAAQVAEAALEGERSKAEAASEAQDSTAAIVAELRKELSAGAASVAGAGEEGAAMEEELVATRMEVAVLRAELDDARFEVEIASEAAAEDGMSEPPGMREATRLRNECAELRSLIQASSSVEAAVDRSAAAAGPDGHKGFAPPLRTTAFSEPGGPLTGSLLALDSDVQQEEASPSALTAHPQFGSISPPGSPDRSGADSAAEKNDTPTWGGGHGEAMQLTESTSSIGALRQELRLESEACTRLRDEATQEAKACAQAQMDRRMLGGQEDSKALCDEAARLRLALSEETAKCRRLGRQALQAEESRRHLLRELAEDAEAEADLQALAKVVGRAAKAIAAVSREAPLAPLAPQIAPEARPPAASGLRSAASDTLSPFVAGELPAQDWSDLC